MKIVLQARQRGQDHRLLERVGEPCEGENRQREVVMLAGFPHIGTLARPSGADNPHMRSVIGLCATFGMFAGGYVPELWGSSSFSPVSLLFGAAGGIAGVWLGVRLSA